MKLKLKHHFDAAHRLDGYSGKCSNLHGHRWEVEVSIEGDIDEKTGMLMDFTQIKKIIDELDHKALLRDCAENTNLINVLNEMKIEIKVFNFKPTAENIAIYLKTQIKEILINSIVEVSVWESLEAQVVA